MQKITRLVGFNDRGRRVGQSHPRAVLSDRDVELMRQLYEAYPRGHPQHWSYGQLAVKFECPKKTVHNIVTYLRRVEATIYRKVPITVRTVRTVTA